MTPQQISATLQLALVSHRAGNLAEARRLYQRVLAEHPQQPDALHLLGTLSAQQGHREEAIELLTRAVAVHPAASDYHNNLGNVYRESGKPNQAIESYRKAIALSPRMGEAWNNLGIALADAGKSEEAVEAYQTALSIDPRLDHTLSNLGIVLIRLGRLQQAVESLERAIELAPRSAIAYDNLGIALRESRRVDESVAAHQKAIELNPNSAPAYSNLSISLIAIGRVKEAVAAAKKAIELSPGYAEAHNNLGNALAESGQAAEAIAAYRRAIELRPGYVTAWSNLGISLNEVGSFADALAASEKAVELGPDDASARFNLGINCLLSGDFERGWPLYESRLRCTGLLKNAGRDLLPWDGSALIGRSLLIYAEQGLGDTVQFVRYAPMIAAQGGRVIVECDPSLHRIVGKIQGVAQGVAPGDPVERCDVQCSILSLPALFQTTLATIPAAIPYITPDAASISEWRERLEAASGIVLKIGLAWAGRAGHRNDRNRSMTLEQLAPLASSRIDYFSLQKGPAAEQAANPPAKMRLVDPTDVLYDFHDTAAMIANLDLVLTVDTVIAHLAGAMGKPVWLMLPFNPDWRWMLTRGDSPWYPTMRLFRQKTPGDWNTVILDIRTALRDFAKKLVNPPRPAQK